MGSRRRAHALLIAGLAALIAAACQEPLSPVDPPGGRIAPTAATRLLVGGTWIDLLAGQPAVTSADVRGLNNAGQVTGARSVTDTWKQWHPYRWTPGTGFEAISLPSTRPGNFNDSTGSGNDINNAGVVVGSMYPGRAFVAVGNTGVELEGLPGTDPETAVSEANAINDAGQIVGAASTSSGKWHAVLWNAAHEIQDLGTLGGPSSYAKDINASGQVIGSSADASGGNHAFLWTAETGMQDFSALIGLPGGGRWRSTTQGRSSVISLLLSAKRAPFSTLLGRA